MEEGHKNDASSRDADVISDVKVTQKLKTNNIFNVTNVFYIDRIKTQDFAVPPFFKKHLSNVFLQEGKVVHFDCTIGGYPIPNVEWYKEIEEIIETSHEQSLDECVGYKYYATKENDSLGLDITNVTTEDFGTYTCKLKNTVGEARSTAMLYSSSDSEKPESLLEQSENEKKKVLLEEIITVIERRKLPGLEMSLPADYKEKKETGEADEKILTVTYNVPETCETKDIKVVSSVKDYQNKPNPESVTYTGNLEWNSPHTSDAVTTSKSVQGSLPSPTASEMKNIIEWIKCGESSDSEYRTDPIPYPIYFGDNAENSERTTDFPNKYTTGGVDSKNDGIESWRKNNNLDEMENIEESNDTVTGDCSRLFSSRDVFESDGPDSATEERSELSDVFEDEITHNNQMHSSSTAIFTGLENEDTEEHELLQCTVLFQEEPFIDVTQSENTIQKSDGVMVDVDNDKENEDTERSESPKCTVLIQEEYVTQAKNTAQYTATASLSDSESPQCMVSIQEIVPNEPPQTEIESEECVEVQITVDDLEFAAPSPEASAYFSNPEEIEHDNILESSIYSSDENASCILKIEEDAEKQMNELIFKLLEFSQRNYVLVSSLKVGRSNKEKHRTALQDSTILEVACGESVAPSTGGELEKPPMHPADFLFDSESGIESKKPEFVIPLEDIEVSPDENVVLNISVTGFPAPRITWFKNGHLLSEEDSGVFHDNLQRNSAVYTCIATNQSGEAESSAVVTIVQPPITEVRGIDELDEPICKKECSEQNEGVNLVKLRMKKTRTDVSEKRRSQIISASLVDYLRSKAKSFRQPRFNYDVTDAGMPSSSLTSVSNSATRMTHDDVALRHGSMLSLTSISTTSFESADETLESDAVWEDVASTLEDDFLSTEELIFPSNGLLKSHKESLNLLNMPGALQESDDDLFNPRPLTPTPVTVKPPFIYEIDSSQNRRPFTRTPTEPSMFLNISDDMETARSENTTPVPPSERNSSRVPSFFVPLKNVVVARGKTCVLNCCVDGYPVPEVTWQRNGIKILPPESNEGLSVRSFMTSFPTANTPGQRFRISSEIKEDVNRHGHTTEYLQHTLTITDCKITDTGEYSVSTVNDHGSAIKRAQLTVKEESDIESTEEASPHFVTKICDSDGMLGEEAVMSFQLVGHPEPDVTILHNHEGIDENKFILEKVDGDGNYTITVRNLTVDDEGEVRVRATNDGGCVECSAELFVDERAATPTPDRFGFIQFSDNADDSELGMMLDIREQLAMQVIAPFFDVITDDVTTTVGSDATFAVRVLAWPAPEVSWYKHGEVMTAGTRYRMESPDFGTHALTIIGVTGSDAGIYTCVVKNDAGEISCKAELIISREKRQSESSEEDIQRESTKKRIKDDYMIGRELGLGSFSSIRSVKNKNTDVEYAAKYIRCTTSQTRDTWLKEIEILKDVSHPNIARYEDHFETRKHIILVMQYVDIEWFEYLLLKDIAYERELAKQVCQICNGLSYLHNKEIPVVHLDMKPENIMVTKDGSLVKIIDFGSAKEMKNGQNIKWDFGNPEFVSPEVVTSQTITVACDMWALGVIIYVAISGVSPLLGESDYATVLQVKSGEWQFDSRMFESISGDAKNFIQNLMVLNPNKRMSAEEAMSHAWIIQKDVDEKSYPLTEGKLKYFLSRRKWQRSLVTPKTSLLIRSISSLLKREYDSTSIAVSRVLVSDYVSSSTVTESDDDIDDVTLESSQTTPKLRSHHQRNDRKKIRLEKTSISIEDTIDLDKEHGSLPKLQIIGSSPNSSPVLRKKNVLTKEYAVEKESLVNPESSGNTRTEENVIQSEVNNASGKSISLHPVNPRARLQMIGKKVSFEDEQLSPVFCDEIVKLETVEQLESTPSDFATEKENEIEVLLLAAQMPEIDAPNVSSGPPGVNLDRPQSVSKLLKEERRKIKPNRGRDAENISTKDKIKKKLSSITIHRRHRSFDYNVTTSSSDDEERLYSSKKNSSSKDPRNKSKLSIFSRRKRSAIKGNSLDLPTVPLKEIKPDREEKSQDVISQTNTQIKGILKRGGSSDTCAQSDPYLQKSSQISRSPSPKFRGANLESMFGPKPRQRRPLMKGVSLDLDMVAERSVDSLSTSTRKPRLSAYERRKLQMRRGSSAESALPIPPRISGLRGPLLEKEASDDEPTAGMSLRRSLTGLKDDSPNHGRSSSTPVELKYPVFERGKFSPLALSPRAPLTSPIRKYSSLSRSFFSQSMDVQSLQETIPEDNLGGKKSLSVQLPTTSPIPLSSRSRSTDRNLGRKTRSAEKRIPGESYAPYLKNSLVDHGLSQTQSTVTLSCLIDAYPFPEIVWYKDNEEILACDRIEIISEPSITKFQLKIRNLILPSDYGKYSCEVMNSIGTIKTSCTLSPAVVPDKPSAPEFAGTDGKNVWVTWNPPKNCAASPMAYMLQHREMAAMQWVTVNESLKDTIYKIEKLRSTTSYRFRVRAMNNAGIGPFSKVSQRIQLNPAEKSDSLQYTF